MARFNNFSWQETLLTIWEIYYGGSFDGAGYEKAVIKHGGNTGERCKLRDFYNNITSSKYFFFAKVKEAKRVSKMQQIMLKNHLWTRSEVL